MRSIQRSMIAAIAFLFIIPLAQASAEEPTNDLEIILDASGSMWAQVGGEAKIAVAKKVLVDLVDSLKDRKDLALGIRAYGHQSHRSKKDCKDTKLELAFGPPDVAKAKQLVGKIKAQGQTPIAFSLTQAKGDFDLSKKRKRTIILITDGLESCDGDPCAVAKELAAAGVKVDMHVVGFDLGEKEMAALKCLVEPSKGLILAAGNAGQLKAALDKIIKKALAENLVVLTKNAKGKPIDGWTKVFKAGTKEEVGSRGGERMAFKIPAGTYDLLVTDAATGQKKTLAGIVLTEDKMTKKEVVFSGAKLGGMVKKTSGAPTDGWIKIFTKDQYGEEKEIHSGASGDKPRLFDVPPGTYKMTIQDSDTGQKKVFENIAVADGDKIIKEVSFGKAKLGGMVRKTSGAPTDGWIKIFGKDQYGEEKEIHSGASGDKPRLFDVPPGTYKMTIQDSDTGQKKVFENIAVADGQEIIKEASFGKAKLGGMVRKTSGAPTGGWIKIFGKDQYGEEKEIHSGASGDKPRLFDVVPGTYKMILKDTDTRQKKVFENIAVADGQEVIKEASFGKAKLGGLVKDSSGAPTGGWIKIFGKDQYGEEKEIHSGGTGNKPRIFDVVPGTYKMVLKESKSRKEKVIENIKVGDGQEIIKEVEF